MPIPSPSFRACGLLLHPCCFRKYKFPPRVKTLSFPRSQSLGRAGEKAGEGSTSHLSIAVLQFPSRLGADTHTHCRSVPNRPRGGFLKALPAGTLIGQGTAMTESHSRRCDNHVIQRAGEHLSRMGGELWCGVIHSPVPPPSTATQSEKDE